MGTKHIKVKLANVFGIGFNASGFNGTARESVPTRKPMKDLLHWYPMLVGVGNLAYDVKADSHGLIRRPNGSKIPKICV